MTRSVPGRGNDRPRHRVATLLVAAFLTAMALAGCGGEGTSTRCSLDSCTVTFDRGVEAANAQILGVEARLVDVNGDQVTVEVAGQQVQLQVNQTAQVGGFDVSVQDVTEQQVVVEVRQSDGGGG